MIYLIGQLAGLLLLAAAFAALAGWAYAARRAAPDDANVRRQREGLIHDLVGLASSTEGVSPTNAVESEREVDAARRLAELNTGRIAELEGLLAAARARADEAAAQAAEFERAMNERAEPLEAQHIAIEPQAAAAAVDDDVALQAWRLRYFEQRVKYLEGKARDVAPAAPVAQSVDAAPPVDAWRARVAAAEANFLADEVRAQTPSVPEPAPEAEPFAANVDTDMMLRWRMLYLERRVGYLQAQLAEAPAPAPEPLAVVSEAGPDPDRWKWRARYLEARTRHLEECLAQAPTTIAPLAAPVQEDEAEPPAPAPSSARRVKPAMLAAARNGAPDDLTLIDGVSLQQQSTFYSLGVFHFDQIAAWSPENAAWVDNYLRLRGRIETEEWIEQAADLAREGPAAARRVLEDEDA